MNRMTPRAAGVRPRPLRASRAACTPEAIGPPSSGQGVLTEPVSVLRAQVPTEEAVLCATRARLQGASRLCEAPPSSTTSRGAGRRPAACPAVGGMGLASSPSPFDAPDSAGRYALAKLPCGACAAASPHVVSELVQVARLEDVGELPTQKEQACATNRANLVCGLQRAPVQSLRPPSTQ